MDLGLPPELGVDRLHGEAVGLGAAVAAALADALVDEDALDRLGDLAALALAAQLGGALLVVDEDGDALHRGQHLLRLDEPVPVPDVDPLGQPHALVAVEVLGRDDDPASRLRPSNSAASSGIAISPTACWPPVMATAPLYSSL